MCTECEPLGAEEYLYRRILPKQWAIKQNRPSQYNFQLRDDELGVSFFRSAGCTPDEVIQAAPSTAFGLVRLPVGEVPENIVAVQTHPETLTNETLRRAHVELRFPDAAGGQDLPESARVAFARVCGGVNALKAPAMD